MLIQWRMEFGLACRRLARTKVFTGVAVITLALGFSGVTIMFALMQGVLLRPLPVHEQHRVVVAWKELPSSGFTHYPFGDVEIEEVAAESRLFDHVAGVSRNGVGRRVVTVDGASIYVRDALVTGGFFDVLGVTPVLGRTIVPEDDREGAEPVVMISHGFWQRRYGSVLDVIGRRVTLAAKPLTIVGVLPPGFDYPVGAEMWRTTRSVPSAFADAARREVDLVGRLVPDATIEQATAELTGLTRRLEAIAPPGVPRGLNAVVRGLHEVMVGDIRPAMLALFAAVSLVLVIASANVANLLLLRGETRRSELAVRRALGASRTATVRQFFLESLALGLGASGVGLLVAHWSLPGLLARAPDQLPRVEWVGIDATVVFFAAVMTLVTTGVAALAPALAVGGNAMSELRGAGRGVTGSVTRRGRQILVVAQVSLAVMIVAAAGVVIQSLLRLQQVETGVADDRLVFVEIALTTPEYTDAVRRAQFFDHLALSLEAAPGISSVTAVNTLPFSAEQGWDVPSFSVEGQTVERAAENPSLNLESVDPSYFETFGVPLRNGRSFTEDDREDTPLVAIVSEDVAALTWPNQDPVGKRLKPGPPDSPNPWRTVVAVAASTRYRDLSKDRPTLYLPAAQFLDTAWLLVLQTTEPVAHVATFVTGPGPGYRPGCRSDASRAVW